MLDAFVSQLLCLTLQSSIMLFLLLPGLIATPLGNVDSDQLDIGTVGDVAGSVASLPQQLVLRTKSEVRSSAVNVAQSEAAVERFRSGCRV